MIIMVLKLPEQLISISVIDSLIEKTTLRSRRKAALSVKQERAASSQELRNVLDIMGKYYAPTHEWSSKIEVKTTIPSRTELGFMLMFGATAAILALWLGNYKHYKISF